MSDILIIKIKNIIFISSILLSFTISATIKEQGFEFKKHSEKNGVIVFKSLTKNKDGVLPIKGQTLLNSSFKDVKNLLDDFSQMKDWVPDLEDLKVSPGKKKNTVVQYLRYHAPWPFNDRTFLLEMEILNDTKLNTVKYKVKSIIDGKHPKNKKYVRGHTEYGYIEAISINKTQTKINMFIYSDLKGFIPKWIMGYVQLSWPSVMFDNLKRLLDRPQITQRN